MKLNFDINKQQFAIIESILEEYLPPNCKVWVFGSRAKNKAYDYSDLDLALESQKKIDKKIIRQLKEAFADSLLPYTVDVLDINAVELYFKQIIDQQKIEFPFTPRAKMPQLRFPEFSGDWEEKKLGDIFNISAGGDINKSNTNPIQNEKYKYPVYANSGKNKGLYSYSDIYKQDEDCVTVTGRGSLGLAVARYDKFYPIVRLLVLRGKQELNIKFFEEAINLVRIYNESTGVPQLTAPQFKSYKTSYPCLPEQTKIAEFLTAVDTKIEQLSKKQELLEKYKKSLMQKIFSQAIRFKADDGSDYPDWEETKLGDIITEVNLRTVTNNQYPILSSTKSGIKIQSDYFNKQTASENNIGYKIVERGNFTYRSMSDTGSFTFNLQDIIDIGIVSPAYPVFKTEYLVGNNFLLTILNFSFRIKQQLLAFKTGGTRYALRYSKFTQLLINLPSLQEQLKISNFLSSIDSKIEQVNKQLDESKQFKKALLQQMFI